MQPRYTNRGQFVTLGENHKANPPDARVDVRIFMETRTLFYQIQHSQIKKFKFRYHHQQSAITHNTYFFADQVLRGPGIGNNNTDLS